jgi:hypothetical protein
LINISFLNPTREGNVKKLKLFCVFVVGLMPFLLISSNASAAGFINKKVTCPTNDFVLIPNGGRANIKDVMISTNLNTRVVLKFTPGPIIFLTAYIKASESFVTNLQGQVEGEDEQGLKLDCSGAAGTVVWVTIVGTGAL